MKTCEKCLEGGETVEVFEKWIQMFNAPDVLYSIYWFHEGCAPTGIGWRKSD